MLSDGTWLGTMRDPDPTEARRFPGAEKKLAKICVLPEKLPFGSYHATHGTRRLVPAKSIEGASASALVTMLSDAGNPCVTQAPALKARTKICCPSLGLLLERRPRHLQVSGRDGAALDVRGAGIPGGVDAVRRVAAVDLRAVGRQADECRRGRAREHQGGRDRHGRKTHVPSDPHRAPPSGGTRVQRPLNAGRESTPRASAVQAQLGRTVSPR